MSFKGKASKIAAFAAVSYIVDYSFQLVDIYWVAKLGAGAPTAIAIVSSGYFLILALNEIIGVSTVPLFAQPIGANKHDLAGQVIFQSILFKAFLGGLMVIVFYIYLENAIPHYDIDKITEEYIYSYGRMIWPSLILIPVYSTMMTALRSIGEESKTVIISIGALLLNAVMTPLLLFGTAGFNGLGISGAALATVLTQLMALLFSIYFLHTNRIGVSVFSKRHISWLPRLYWDLVRIGLPVGGVVVLYNLEQAIVTAIVSSFSTEVSDGFGIGARIYNFFYMASFGIAVGVSVSVGHYIGKGQLTLVQKQLPIFVFQSTLLLAIISSVIYFYGYEIVSLFTENPNSQSSGANYLRHMYVALIFLCAMYSFNGAFEGSGRNVPTLVVGVLMYLIIEFPIIYTLTIRDDMNLNQLWVVIILTSAFGAIFTRALFQRRYWEPKHALIE